MYKSTEHQMPSSLTPFPQAEHEIGLVGAIRPLVSFFIAPAVCALADKTGKQQQVC